MRDLYRDCEIVRSVGRVIYILPDVLKWRKERV